LALQLSEQGGIGLARMMVEQMQTRGYVSEAETGSTDRLDTNLKTTTEGLPLTVRDTATKAFELPAAKAYELPANDMQGARSKD